MRLPLSWLREYLDIDLTAEQVAEGLDRRGFKLEALETVGRAYPGVVVARVLEVTRHPNADRLTLCRVDGGAGEVRVVCGAPNVHAGMMAPLATVGARLPDGTVIQRAKIRGVESQGMLCSASELELAEDRQGILSLPDLLGGDRELAVGMPLEEVLGAPEPVLDVEVFFNRGDALSIVGLVREVAGFAGARWTEVGRRRLAASWKPVGGFDLAVEDEEGCTRYLAQGIRGVKVGPSPRWAVRRLEAMGVRSINNLVDASNLVMFELGQPLHAFDLDRLAGPAIRVRRARAGEALRTLDGKARTLDPEILVIADRERPVALAGIMGGEESEVAGATTRILLECATFQPARIRRGVVRLGLSSDASRRFEKGVDPQIGPAAVARFLELLGEFCPGMRPGPSAEAHPRPFRAAPVTLRPERCDALLGIAIPPDLQARHLRSLGFGVEERGGRLAVTPPSWRSDVEIEEDLVEEVARAHGYDALPEPAPELRGAWGHRTPRERLVESARRALLARGFQEAWSTTLVSEPEARAALELVGEPPERLVPLVNPMSREGAMLRPSPVPGLLRAVAHNLRQGEQSLRLFEIAVGFTGTGLGARPQERLTLAAALTGMRYAHAHDAPQAEADFFEAKGLWEAVLGELRVDTPEWRAYAGPGWKPGAGAQVASLGSRIGWAGVAAPRWLDTWGIEVPVHLLVILLDPLVSRAPVAALARSPGRFPPVRRDLAFFVPDRVSYAELHGVVAREAGGLLRSVDLFDVYAGPGTPAGMRSLAFTLQFGHEERTLAESEVEDIQRQIVAAVARECGGRLREK
jgi:phenylalanyl-tRNA synthetase beta chain